MVRGIALVINGTFPKSIRLADHIAPDLWSIVPDPTQIHQVMLNLCVNARDAMPDGGTLRLRAENVVLDAAAARAIDGARPGSFVMLHIGSADWRLRRRRPTPRSRGSSTLSCRNRSDRKFPSPPFMRCCGRRPAAVLPGLRQRSRHSRPALLFQGP
jgi:hypothetical protein